MSGNIPRSKDNDYSDDMLKARQAFIEERTPAKLQHTKHYSFDPATMASNTENVFGVAQVPIGLAGPLLVNGEYAKGEFFVPMATIEGTLLASYNRGMKLLKECGGVTTTVCGEAMQRAPAFVFDDARDARDFGLWLTENFAEIKALGVSAPRAARILLGYYTSDI